MRKPKGFLRVTVTLHADGTLVVLFEWICSNPSIGLELATPRYWGYSLTNDMSLQAFIQVLKNRR